MDPEAFTASSIITMVCIDMSFYKRALYLMSNNHMKTCIIQIVSLFCTKFKTKRMYNA